MNTKRVNDEPEIVVKSLREGFITEFVVPWTLDVEAVQGITEVEMAQDGGKIIDFITSVTVLSNGNNLFILTPIPFTNAKAIKYLKKD